jgi:putative PIN family toxin of toxin-antitoxin system
LRVVVDPGVLVSGLIGHPDGAPARVVDALLTRQLAGIGSPMLFAELEQVLSRRWFEERITRAERSAYLGRLRACLDVAADPPASSGAVRDPKDAYLIALARDAGADVLVSGDRDLLEIEHPDPLVLSPRQVADRLDADPSEPS